MKKPPAEAGGDQDAVWRVDFKLESLRRAFALRFLARQLARATDGLRLLTRPLFGGLFEMLPKLHLTENTLALHLLLKSLQRLIDVIVANQNLHLTSPSFQADLEFSE